MYPLANKLSCGDEQRTKRMLCAGNDYTSTSLEEAGAGEMRQARIVGGRFVSSYWIIQGLKK